MTYIAYLLSTLTASAREMVDLIRGNIKPEEEQPMAYQWPITRHKRRYHAPAGEGIDASLEHAVIIAREHGEVEFRSAFGVEFRIMPYWNYHEAMHEFWRAFYADALAREDS